VDKITYTSCEKMTLLIKL